MKLSELIAAFRDLARDHSVPPLWSDPEVTLYINQAVNEAAERASLILDAESSEVCEVYVEAGMATYELHPSVFRVKRAKLDLGRVPLDETSVEELDAHAPGWETRSGTPKAYVITAENRLTFDCKPAADDVLRLHVYRLPIRPLAKTTDKPEIAERHHYRLLDWALRCAYLKPDSETFDGEKAADHEARFTASFGVRQDANVQRKQQDRRPPVVRMGPW